MITERQIEETLKQYEKHGWILRRVLLSARAKELLPPAIFGDTDVSAADFDALWFSRASSEGRAAWELRSLSATPFALVELFDDDDPEEIRAESRTAMETQMKERASKPVA